MSAAPSDRSAEVTAPAPPAAPQPPVAAPAPAPQPAAPDRPPRDPRSRFFLAATAALFFGWLAWLGYTALTKSREPIVSHAQAALAPVPVVATVTADDKGAPAAKVTVVEPLRPGGPPAKTQLVVANLPAARGFTGAGDYLLLLAPDPLAFQHDGGPVFQLVGPRPSSSDSDPATIYKWSADVEAQARNLYRAKD
ncbi:MAG: hypothetical protein J0I06_15645 [Planctomycetes bacterium]|nr:hypothetical protein [Planctomycetota bacterium]